MTSRRKGRHSRVRLGVALVSLALIAAACGGGGKKSSTATTAEATTSTSTGETTTTLASEASSSTTAAVAGASSTTTTAKGTTATTKKSNASATTIAKPKPQTNLLNVQATTTTTAAGKQPQPGGTLTMAVAADTVNFDPANGSSNSSATEGPRNSAIYDTLFFQDSVTYDLVAQLAAGMTSTDGKTWDLKLRPNVKFTDGTPLDADAVKFNIDRIKDPNTPPPSPNRSSANQITSETVVDPTTLRMTLTAPSGQFPRLFGSTLAWVASPTAIQKTSQADYAVHPVGAGPFMLKDYVRGDHTTLVRNPGYWAAPLPYLDQVNVRIIPDDSQRLNSLYTGEIQMGRVNRPQDCADAKSKHFGCSVAILNGANDLIFNNSKAPFNSKAFRQAVGEAIDRDAYNTVVEGGFGLPVSSMFQSTSPFYEPDVIVSKYDPADASAKFAAAFAANGNKKVSFTISASQGKSFDAATFFQGQLLQDGTGQCKACNFKQYIDVQLQQVTTVSLVSNSVNGTFDAQVWANLPLDPEPNLYISFLSTSSTNFNRYSNSQVDAALNTEHTSLDPAQRKAALRTFQQVWADEQPSFMYARVQQGYVYNSNVQDVRLFEDGTALLDRIWIQKSG